MYSEKFFTDREQLARTSAIKIVDIICELFMPGKVVDFGCANGIWLKAFLDKGAKNIQGIDGPWVKKDLLRIPESSFFVHNLTDALPIGVVEKADLAVSLEVAEHLPPARAASFIEELTNAADAVLFSAAVIKQGGTGHLNEQPQSYWSSLFAEHGFRALDIIRPKVWNDPDVNVVYRQNCLVYVKKGVENPLADVSGAEPHMLDVIHPYLYEKRLTQAAENVKIIRRIKRAVKKIVR